MDGWPNVIILQICYTNNCHMDTSNLILNHKHIFISCWLQILNNHLFSTKIIQAQRRVYPPGTLVSGCIILSPTSLSPHIVLTHKVSQLQFCIYFLLPLCELYAHPLVHKFFSSHLILFQTRVWTQHEFHLWFSGQSSIHI